MAESGVTYRGALRPMADTSTNSSEEKVRHSNTPQWPVVVLLFVVLLMLWVSSMQGNLANGGIGDGRGSGNLPGHLKPFGGHRESLGHVPVLKRGAWPTAEELYTKYILKNQPVLLKGYCADWTAAKLYHGRKGDARLGDVCPKYKFDVEFGKVENRDDPQYQWPMKKFLKKYKESNVYMVSTPCPELKRQIEMPKPLRCSLFAYDALAMWFSHGGTKSVLHTDDGENFLNVLDGTKMVLLVHQKHSSNLYIRDAKKEGTSPINQVAVDMTTFPNVQKVEWSHARVERGDTLFIPSRYWHQVQSLDGRNLAVNMFFNVDVEQPVAADDVETRTLQTPISKKEWPRHISCSQQPGRTVADYTWRQEVEQQEEERLERAREREEEEREREEEGEEGSSRSSRTGSDEGDRVFPPEDDRDEAE